MWRILAFFTILQFASCSCPPGFELVNNECRGRESRRITTYYDEALAMAQHECDEILSHPIIMHSEADEDYWCELLRETVTADTVIGLMCNKTSNKWVWVDGTPVDYKPKSHGTMLDGPCLDYADYTWQLQASCGWGADNSHRRFITDVFCSAPHRQAVPRDEICEEFEDDSEDKVCYQVGLTASTWDDALNICMNLGANLVSIHNAQENSFVRRVAVSRGAVNGVFLGGFLSGGTVFWMDYSRFDYENFGEDYPSASTGPCLVMDTSTSSGQWRNQDCTDKMPFVCHRPENAKPECKSEHVWEEGKLIVSPGFPYSASTTCEFFISVKRGNKVKVEINLEANPCCDFLVLYDQSSGGNMIANLTGELRSVSYTSPTDSMGISWQPKGGYNVRGYRMTFTAV